METSVAFFWKSSGLMSGAYLLQTPLQKAAGPPATADLSSLVELSAYCRQVSNHSASQICRHSERDIDRDLRETPPLSPVLNPKHTNLQCAQKLVQHKPHFSKVNGSHWVTHSSKCIHTYIVLGQTSMANISHSNRNSQHSFIIGQRVLQLSVCFSSLYPLSFSLPNLPFRRGEIIVLASQHFICFFFFCMLLRK